MATHGDIGLSQPAASTTTFKLDAITLDANSTAVVREVMVLGSPETTNALTAVLAAAPASTAWGAVVRIAGGPSSVVDLAVRAVLPSTAADNLVRPIAPSTYGDGGLYRVAQSSAGDLNVTVGGSVIVRSTAANLLASVYQSTAADLNVTVAGYSTTVNVSSLGGAVIARSSAANFLASVYQSTAADLNVTVAGYSTIAAISSVSGRVGTMPFSTAWASSAGFHFDSSGAIQVTGASASTLVSVRGDQSSNSSNYLSVRLTNGTAFTDAVSFNVHGSTGDFTGSTIVGQASLLRSGAIAPGSTDHFVTQWGSTSGAAFMIPVTDSGVSIIDSTNRALNVNVVAGAAGGSTIMTISTGSLVALGAHVVNSTGAFDGSTIRGHATFLRSGAIAAGSTDHFVGAWGTTGGALYSALVTDSGVSIMDSTNRALNVNVVAGAAGGSTIMTVSTGSVRVHQSTAADLNVTVAGYSTTVNVSSVTGPVTVRSTANTLLASVYQSTAADLNVTVAGYSTTVNVSSGVIRGQVYTSSGGAVEGSTATPAHGVLGVHVRQVPSSYQSTILAGASSNSTIVISAISSVATLKHKVYAYFIGASTSGNVSTLVFLSSGSGGDAGAAKNRWQVLLSSAYGAANLAISPQGGACLFMTDAGEALNYRIESASTRITPSISLSWMTEL